MAETPKKLTWDEGLLGGIDVEGNIFLITDVLHDDADEILEEIVKRCNGFPDLKAKAEKFDMMVKAFTDGGSFVKGDFAEGLLFLADNLGKLNEVSIAVNKLWLKAKVKDITEALAKQV